jgi:YD repeat-containing protein
MATERATRTIRLATSKRFELKVSPRGSAVPRTLPRTRRLLAPVSAKITTQWHATFRLPTQIDEPGKRTTFTYDSSGNLLTKTVLDTSTSESRTWTYTSQSKGPKFGRRSDTGEMNDCLATDNG